jgi:signal peptidase I
MSSSSTSPQPHSEHNGSAAEKKTNPLVEIVQFALIAILIVVPIRMFVAQPFIVSGASMEQTFDSGEYLIVDQVTYHLKKPTRGEVIVFRYPKDPSKFFIKRIIGIPGDTVTIDGATVMIKNTEHPDGVILSEPYITDMAPSGFVTERLGDREYFVMGDNRNFSSDSRSWGVLQEERIIGRAYLRLYPPQEFEYLPGVASDQVTSS